MKSRIKLVMILIIVVGVVIYFITNSGGTVKGGYGEEETVFLRVDNKYDKQFEVNGPDVFMMDVTLFNEEGDSIGVEVIRNQDNRYKGKRNSADINLHMKENGYYECLLRGRRNYNYSEFRNVITQKKWKRPDKW